MSNYPNLFSPIKIGTMEVKNRLFLAPMGTAFGEYRVHKPTKKMADYYAARAAGGTGLIIVEQSVVQQRGLWSLNGGGLWSDEFVPGWKMVVDRVHEAGGKIIIQVGHLGRSTIESFNGGLKPVAPSAVPDHFLDNEVDELTLEDIDELKEDFRNAFRRCKEAGFDGIEIHCTHGYMLASFLSGRSNKRTDKYGGTLEGRLKLPIEVIQLARQELGKDYPIIARLAATEANGGRSLEETRVVAKALVEAGLDGLDISSGSYSELDWEIPPSYFSYAMNMENIEQIKKAVSVPILASGRITEPRLAEQLIAEGRCDMVGINRAGIADPEWGNKASSGNTESIRRCIGCVRCIDAVFSGALRCTVNPLVGKEEERIVTPAEKKKNILVVGGGPVGLESAILAAKRGHKVTLVEKQRKLGGQINSAAVPPHKYEMGSLITTQIYEAEKLGITIQTGVHVDLDYLQKAEADEVILAVGARHTVPNIKGIQQTFVTTAIDILEGKAHAGKKVVIIGGNLIGCETAEFLGEYGKEITLLEMTGEIGADLAIVPKPHTLKRIASLGVNLLTDAKVMEVTPEGTVLYDCQGQELVLEQVDTVVLAAGMRPNNELCDAALSLGKPVHVLGDACGVSRVMENLDMVYEKLLNI